MLNCEHFKIEDQQKEDPIDPDEPSRIHFRNYSIEDFKLLNLLGEGGFGKVMIPILFGKLSFLLK